MMMMMMMVVMVMVMVMMMIFFPLSSLRAKHVRSPASARSRLVQAALGQRRWQGAVHLHGGFIVRPRW